jgi:hypothetical protein
MAIAIISFLLGVLTSPISLHGWHHRSFGFCSLQAAELCLLCLTSRRCLDSAYCLIWLPHSACLVSVRVRAIITTVPSSGTSAISTVAPHGRTVSPTPSVIHRRAVPPTPSVIHGCAVPPTPSVIHGCAVCGQADSTHLGCTFMPVSVCLVHVACAVHQ